MSIFVRCPDCGINRLNTLAECGICRLRRQHGLCRCNRPLIDNRCAHCDNACPGAGCHSCDDQREWSTDAEDGMRETPHPTVRQLREPPTIEIGGHELCPACDGRTYTTQTGTWCPRAFCGDGNPT